MSELGVVVPLKEKAYEEALGLVREGRPFELEETDFARHRVYATNSEIVLVFESPGPSATLRLAAEDRRRGRFQLDGEEVGVGGGRLGSHASWDSARAYEPRRGGRSPAQLDGTDPVRADVKGPAQTEETRRSGSAGLAPPAPLERQS